MDYKDFIYQKYSREISEIRKLMDDFNHIQLSYEKLMMFYKINILTIEIPEYLFAYSRLLTIAIWKILEYIKISIKSEGENSYAVLKLNELLLLLTNGYRLTEQECSSIAKVFNLPTNTSTEKFIANARKNHITYYICKQVLPYWQDKLTPKCIEYVTAKIEQSIKDTNEFISKEDLLRSVYYVNPRPSIWRELLTEADIPFDD